MFRGAVLKNPIFLLGVPIYLYFTHLYVIKSFTLDLITGIKRDCF